MTTVTGEGLTCNRGVTIRTTSSSPTPHSGVAWLKTEEGKVVSKQQVLRQHEAGELPAPEELLRVKMIPSGEPWTLRMTLNFSSKPPETREFPFTPEPEKLDEEGTFASAFVFVSGSEALPEGFSFPHAAVLDVSEPGGHAPSVDFATDTAGPVRITLGGKSESGSGELGVLVQDEVSEAPVEGATVKVGEHSDQTGNIGLVNFLGLAAGAHTFEVSAEGYQTQSGTVEVKADESVELKIALTSDRLHSCVCVPGLTFDFDSSFLKPSVLDHMSEVDAALEKFPAARLLVMGHTDRVGDEVYNKKLSERRAFSVFCFITDDTEGWEALYHDEGWGLKIVQTVLKDLGHDPGGLDGLIGPNTRGAMRSFLEVPASASVQNDAALRQRLFLAYMQGKHDVKATPEQFMKPRFMGCGEFNPVAPPSPSEKGNEANRRVVVYLFKEDQTLPCALEDTGPCKAEIAKPSEHGCFDCAFYDSIATLCHCECADKPKKKKEKPPNLVGTAILEVIVTKEDVPLIGASVLLADGPSNPPVQKTQAGPTPQDPPMTTFTKLRAGKYIVNGGKKTLHNRRPVTLTEGGTERVIIKLVEPTKPANLSVTVMWKAEGDPAFLATDAIVTLAGPTSRQLSAPNGSVSNLRIEAGAYTVTGSATLTAGFFGSDEKSITLQEGGAGSVTIILPFTKTPPQTVVTKKVFLKYTKKVRSDPMGPDPLKPFSVAHPWKLIKTYFGETQGDRHPVEKKHGGIFRCFVKYVGPTGANPDPSNYKAKAEAVYLSVEYVYNPPATPQPPTGLGVSVPDTGEEIESQHLSGTREDPPEI